MFDRRSKQAVVVGFASGDPERARAMAAEVRLLVPDLKHYLVSIDTPISVDGVTAIVVSSSQPFLEARRALQGMRIGLAPVLFPGTWHALQAAALCAAPHKLLAFNARGERHHLRLTTAIASLLFLRGVSLDRIWLRPWSGGDGRIPEKYETLAGRHFRQGRRRVGILVPYFPWPLDHGGAVRMYHLTREAARKFDIVLFAFSGPVTASPVMEFVSRAYLMEPPRYRKPRWSSILPPEVAEYASPALHALLDQVRRESNLGLLQTEYTQLAQYGGDILVEHDVTFDLYNQVAARQNSLSNRWNAFRWRLYELRMTKAFPRVIVMAAKDASLLPGAQTCIIPNGADLARFIPTEEPAGQRVLFIGSFRHFPNILAFRFFTEQVWPLLRRHFPAIELTAVTGLDPQSYWKVHTADPFPQSGNGIEILGFVADVCPLYESTNLVIAPTLVSAGTNLKVLEAMAMRRAVVATPSGCQGLGLEHGQSVWIASTSQGLADGVIKLLEDPALRTVIANQAHRIATLELDWKQIGRKQNQVWAELLGDVFTLRPGAVGDLDATRAIQRSSTGAADWEPEDYLKQHFYVVEAKFPKSELAGFAVWQQITTGEWELLNVAVSPHFRRRGVASLLMDKLFKVQPDTVFLEVRESNVGAQRLYGDYGFHPVGVRRNYYQDPPENAIVMRFQKC